MAGKIDFNLKCNRGMAYILKILSVFGKYFRSWGYLKIITK